MPFKLLLSLASIGALGTSTVVTYHFLNSKETSNEQEKNTKTTLENESSKDVQSELKVEATTHEQNSPTTELSEQLTDSFSGWLVFTTDKENHNEETGSRLGRKNIHYRTYLSGSPIQEEDGEDEEEPKEEKTNFSIEIKTNKKKDAEEYLRTLTENFKSNKESGPIYDKETLKTYFESHKEEFKFKDYFEASGTEIYDQILEKLKN